MPLRWGPGPVFVHESIAATRRWQFFALRSLFVLGLLAGLAVAWLVFFSGHTGARPAHDQAACLARGVLLLRDRHRPDHAGASGRPGRDGRCDLPGPRRGNLTHLFVTDLSSAEIVLGKLAARLVPVFGLVAATIPVLAIAGLLGGVIFEAILCLTLITLALAVLGCSLALAISVRATKTHEVLMAVYGIEGVWILGPFLWQILQSTGGIVRVPHGSSRSTRTCWRGARFSGRVPGVSVPLAVVLGGALAVSAGLVVYAVLRIRAAEQNRSGPARARAARLARAWQRLTAWRPRPSLDDNPVLWREWRRGRPSRLAKVVWGAFIVLALAGTAQGIVRIADDYRKGGRIPRHRQRLPGHLWPVTAQHRRADGAGRGAGAGQPGRAAGEPALDRPDRPGQVVGGVSGGAGAGLASGDRSTLHRGVRPAVLPERCRLRSGTRAPERDRPGRLRRAARGDAARPGGGRSPASAWRWRPGFAGSAAPWR